MRTICALSIGASLAMVLTLLAPNVTPACVIIYPTVEVGKEFRVKVTGRGHPVSGLKLVLASYPPGRVSHIYSVTDAEGVARFSDLKFGLYDLQPDHDASVSDGAEVQVVSGGPTNVTVALKWPNSTPVSVRSMRGEIRGPDFYPSRVQTQLSLSLLEAVTARVLSKTAADNKGRFSFTDSVPPGPYFLQLNPSGLHDSSGNLIEGMIAVELDGAAKQDTLDLDLEWSDCGLDYGQHEQQPEISVKRICGDVADETGGAVAKAQVVLYASGEDGEVLERTQSGTSGGFTLPERPQGTYEILVRSPGFLPFLRVIRVEDEGEPSGDCEQPIHARLRP